MYILIAVTDKYLRGRNGPNSKEQGDELPHRHAQGQAGQAEIGAGERTRRQELGDQERRTRLRRQQER